MLSGEVSTDPYVDENTEEPGLSTNLAISKADEADDAHAEDAEENVLTDQSDGGETESESKSRRKRKADDKDHQDDHQHLEQLTQELDSSRLPLEHRGLDDHDSHEHHDHSGSTHLVPWFSLSSALLLFAGLTRMHYL